MSRLLTKVATGRRAEQKKKRSRHGIKVGRRKILVATKN